MKLPYVLSLAALLSCGQPEKPSPGPAQTPDTVVTQQTDTAMQPRRSRWAVNPDAEQAYSSLEDFVDDYASQYRSLMQDAVQTYNAKLGLNYSAQDIPLEFRAAPDDRPPPTPYMEPDGPRIVIEAFPKEHSLAYVNRTLAHDEPTVTDSMVTTGSDTYKQIILGSAAHEVGHWIHADKTRGSALWKDGAQPDTTSGMISEGVARYMSRLVNKGPAPRESAYDSVEAGARWDPWVYEAGHAFVKPILDKDFELGLQLLSKDLPKLRSADDIRAYQQELLGKIDSVYARRE